MDTVTIFAQKSNKETQSPVRGLNSSQGSRVEQAKKLHKKQGWKLLNGLWSQVNKKQDTELLFDIGALLTNRGISHRMKTGGNQNRNALDLQIYWTKLGNCAHGAG